MGWDLDIGRSVKVFSSKILLCAVVSRYMICSEMFRMQCMKYCFDMNLIILTYPFYIMIKSVIEVTIFCGSL